VTHGPENPRGADVLQHADDDDEVQAIWEGISTEVPCCALYVPVRLAPGTCPGDSGGRDVDGQEVLTARRHPLGEVSFGTTDFERSM
jgi:hypothetical protein